VRDEVDAIGHVADIFTNARDIFIQRGGAARVERGHRSDDAGLALRNHEIGGRSDKHRSGHDRQTQF